MSEISCPPLTRLDDFTLLALDGPDAESFLHGQISNAVMGLPQGQARWAAYCMPQGRILATVLAWRAGPDAWRLMLARDLWESVARRLRMFVLRAKVTVQHDDSPVWGLAGEAVPPELAQAGPWVHHSQGSTHWITAPRAAGGQARAWRIGGTAADADAPHGADAPDHADALAGADGPDHRDAPHDAPASPADAWHAADIAAGLPWIRQATQELFLPSTLDMDLNGGIDFAKGCYPGQEVIARAHYRGAVKRRLACGPAPWDAGQALPAPGSDLFAGEGEPRVVGRVIDLAAAGGRAWVAAEIRLDDWGTLQWRLGGPDGPVIDFATPRALTADPAP